MKILIELTTLRTLSVTLALMTLIGCGGGSTTASSDQNSGQIADSSTEAENAVTTDAEPEQNDAAVAPVEPAVIDQSAEPTAPPQPEDSQTVTVSRVPEPERFQIGNAVAPINYWMTAWTFNDLIKTAGWEIESEIFQHSQMWAPVFEGQYEFEAMPSVQTDDQGWATSMTLNDGRVASSLTTAVMLNEIEAAYEHGIYTLRYEGEGSIEIEGAAVAATSIGQIEIDYSGGGGIFIHITDTDPQGTGDYLRNISLLRPNADPNQRFTTEYLEYLAPYAIIRPLHMTGDDQIYSTEIDWNNRKTEDNSHYGGSGGAPWEVIVDLANQSHSDLWVNIPIAADDSYIRNLAQLLLEELDSQRVLYIEFGNEIWNFAAPYVIGHNYAWDQARLRWPGVEGSSPDYNNGEEIYPNQMIYSWVGARLVEINTIFEDVWGEQAERFAVIASGQVGASVPFFDNSRIVLEAPVYVGEENGQMPANIVSALAIAPYIGDPRQYDEALSDQWFDRSSPEAYIGEAIYYVRGEGRFGEAAAEPGLRYEIRNDRALAAEYDLPLVAYEGGHHFIGSEFTRDEVAVHNNMYDLYRTFFDVWQEEAGGLFIHFHGIFPRGESEPGQEPNYFQSEHFGIKETQMQTEAEAPRYRALMDEMRELGQAN